MNTSVKNLLQQSVHFNAKIAILKLYSQKAIDYDEGWMHGVSQYYETIELMNQGFMEDVMQRMEKND